MNAHRSPSLSFRRGVAMTAVIGLAAAPALAGCGKKSEPEQTPSPSVSTTAPAVPSGSASPGGPSGPGGPGGPGTSAPQGMLPAGYQPLWPFGSAAEVAAWQASYRSGGHQPWHLSADQTALSFVQGYLGFKEITKVVARSVKGSDAKITVGYPTPENGRPGTAAVIHLIRAGSGQDAPWEVVGTEDTTLTLTTPAYGSTVKSPVTVGGQITGVDENIQVKVLRVGSASPLGTFCCLGAGGRNTPWSAKATFSGGGGGGGRVLTIVAWTGGHLMAVERFAVTAVRG